MNTRATTMAATAMMLGVVAAEVRSQTDIYIAEYAYLSGRMTGVNVGGFNVRPVFTLHPEDWAPLGMVYIPASNSVIWMDSAAGSEIHRIDMNNNFTQSVVAPVAGFARGLMRDALGRLYYSTDNKVQRLNADGTGLVTLYTGPTVDPVSMPRLDVTNGHLYVGTFGAIIRMDLDGSNIKTIVRGVGLVRSVAVDILSGYIYWTDIETNTDFIGRARLDGTDFRVLIDASPGVVTASFLSDLIIDPLGRRLFYADEVNGTVTRCNLDGTSRTVIYTSPPGVSPVAMTFNTGEPLQPVLDCNANGTPDNLELLTGAPDCDMNGFLDACQTNPCPTRPLLLDQGSNAVSTTGKTIGGTTQWQVFQPFDVPSQGWFINEIGLDGYTVNYSGAGVLVRLFRDNGTGQRPNESAPFLTASLDLRFHRDTINWVYAPFPIGLPPARYWLRIEATNPAAYEGSLNYGFSGLPSLSRPGATGTFSDPTPPIALRFVRNTAPPCGTPDFNGDGDIGTDQDIEAFFRCLAGNCCPTCYAGGADFNIDGDIGTDADIESFFRVLAGGPC